jgi:hypothetical protein
VNSCIDDGCLASLLLVVAWGGVDFHLDVRLRLHAARNDDVPTLARVGEGKGEGEWVSE